MRVMIMHKTNASNEAGLMPPKSLILDVGQMVGEMQRAGVLLTGEGLRQSALGVRLRGVGGTKQVVPGPFVGDNELPAALCIMKVKHRDNALAWADRFTDIIGDAEIDIRPVTEPWDLGMVPKPEGLETTRYMAVLKGDAAYEAGRGITAEQRAAIERLLQAMRDTGILQSADLLAPSAEAKRVTFRGGKQQVVIDGPFAESKELIAGFVMLKVASLEEAMEWVPRYGAALRDVEIDLRPLVDFN